MRGLIKAALLLKEVFGSTADLRVRTDDNYNVFVRIMYHDGEKMYGHERRLHELDVEAMSDVALQDLFGRDVSAIAQEAGAESYLRDTWAEKYAPW